MLTLQPRQMQEQVQQSWQQQERPLPAQPTAAVRRRLTLLPRVLV
jgi:hypothetical protein